MSTACICSHEQNRTEFVSFPVKSTKFSLSHSFKCGLENSAKTPAKMSWIFGGDEDAPSYNSPSDMVLDITSPNAALSPCASRYCRILWPHVNLMCLLHSLDAFNCQHQRPLTGPHRNVAFLWCKSGLIWLDERSTHQWLVWLYSMQHVYVKRVVLARISGTSDTVLRLPLCFLPF